MGKRIGKHNMVPGLAGSYRDRHPNNSIFLWKFASTVQIICWHRNRTVDKTRNAECSRSNVSLKANRWSTSADLEHKQRVLYPRANSCSCHLRAESYNQLTSKLFTRQNAREAESLRALYWRLTWASPQHALLLLLNSTLEYKENRRLLLLTKLNLLRFTVTCVWRKCQSNAVSR